MVAKNQTAMTTLTQKTPATVSKATPKKSAFREWIDSIAFAVVAATLIRWLFFSAYMIPTPSMENSLLVGEYLFTSRLHYGATTPITPLQLPLSHQTIWGTSLPAYLDWIQLPQFRLPGFSSVQRGDVVVFHLPVEHPALYEKYGVVLPDLKPHPLDQRTHYIKRCVAIAGDRLELVDGQVLVNGKITGTPAGVQGEYFVATTTAVNETNVFRRNGITDFTAYTETYGDTAAANDEPGYLVKTTKEHIEMLKTYDFVRRISPVIHPGSIKESYLFQAVDTLRWNIDQYGPLLVPQKGLTVALTPANVAIYGEVIQCHEGNEGIDLAEGEIRQAGKRLKEYTFRQDYYFMMGDNRHNSADSRFWGFVPQDHVVGKAVFVWMSIDPDPVSFLKKIRWERLFKTID